MNTMTYDDYVDDLIEEINNLNDNLIIEKTSVTKNNGVTFNGLIMKDKNDDPKNAIVPTIYTDNYYDNDVPVSEAASHILETYDNSKYPDMDLDVNKIIDFDYVKDRIILRLASLNLNNTLEFPYVKFGDLQIRFYIYINKIEVESDKVPVNEYSTDPAKTHGTIAVTNYIFSKWNVSIENLFEIAMENTRRITPYSIEDINDVLLRMIPEEQLRDADLKNGNMYILSNNFKSIGSIYMTDKEALKEVAKNTNSDKIIILPSSIHEVILIPDSSELFKEDKEGTMMLKEMVQSVNTTELPQYDILSYNVYLYDNKKNQISYMNGKPIELEYECC